MEEWYEMLENLFYSILGFVVGWAVAWQTQEVDTTD